MTFVLNLLSATFAGIHFVICLMEAAPFTIKIMNTVAMGIPVVSFRASNSNAPEKLTQICFARGGLTSNHVGV